MSWYVHNGVLVSFAGFMAEEVSGGQLSVQIGSPNKGLLADFSGTN